MHTNTLFKVLRAFLGQEHTFLSIHTFNPYMEFLSRFFDLCLARVHTRVFAGKCLLCDTKQDYKIVFDCG